MEMVEVERSSDNSVEENNNYSLKASQINNEDILFCIDIDPQSMVQMKARKTTTLTRLQAIKQSIVLFVNSKLTINPKHRFAFVTLSHSVSWPRKEFSSEVESTVATMRGLSATTSTSTPDLTTLFQLAAHEAEKSRKQGCILRVVSGGCHQ